MSLLERNWPAVSQVLTVNGDATGILTVASTSGFYSNQLVALKGNSLTTLYLKVLEVLSATTLRVGSRTADLGGHGGNSCAAFTTAAASSLAAPSQIKVLPGNDEIVSATYEAQPTTAMRVITVDRQGNYIDPSGAGSGLVTTINGSVSATTTASTFQYVKVANTTITAANANITTAFLVMSLSANTKILTVINTLNQTVGLTLNDVQFQELESSEGFTLDLGSNGKHINAALTVGIFCVSTTSTAGTIRFQAVS